MGARGKSEGEYLGRARLTVTPERRKSLQRITTAPKKEERKEKTKVRERWVSESVRPRTPCVGREGERVISTLATVEGRKEGGKARQLTGENPSILEPTGGFSVLPLRGMGVVFFFSFLAFDSLPLAFGWADKRCPDGIRTEAGYRSKNEG